MLPRIFERADKVILQATCTVSDTNRLPIAFEILALYCNQDNDYLEKKVTIKEFLKRRKVKSQEKGRLEETMKNHLP